MPYWLTPIIILAAFLAALYLAAFIWTAILKAAERRKARLDQWDTYD